MSGDNNEGSLDELDETEQLDDNDMIIIVDDEGNEREFAVLAVVEVEEVDYAMLAPREQLESDEDGELELFLFKYVESDEGIELSEIEDEKTYEMVREFCSTLLDFEE
jgi:uncharacterized protein YrzB (UPF0473 family)